MARRNTGNAAEPSEQILEFSRGLHPILLRADAAAFSRYLSRWEDVIGDTAELTATPPEQLRRTMAALLRRPQQFGLPPWPAVPSAPPPGPPVELFPPAPAAAPQPSPRPVGRSAPPAAHPGPAPAGAPAARTGAASRHTPPPPAPEPAPEPAATLDGGSYQLDMLTGELVPVAERMLAEAPAPAPYEAPGVQPAGQRKRRRRRPPAGMEQLAFWSAPASGE
jgi:hypothetical protein